jgi:hypothetical protein
MRLQQAERSNNRRDITRAQTQLAGSRCCSTAALHGCAIAAAASLSVVVLLIVVVLGLGLVVVCISFLALRYAAATAAAGDAILLLHVCAELGGELLELLCLLRLLRFARDLLERLPAHGARQ